VCDENRRDFEQQQWKLAIILFSEGFSLQSLLVLFCFMVCGILGDEKEGKRKKEKGK